MKLLRLLGKIAVILIVALLIVGATVALNDRGALAGLTGETAFARGERPEGAGEFTLGERPERGEGHEDGPGGLSSLLDVPKNVGVVAGLVAGVWLLGRGGNRLAARRKVDRKLAEAPPVVEKPLSEEPPKPSGE